MKFFAAIFLTAAVFIQGCGYTTKTALRPEWKTIYISPVVNDINFSNQYERPLYVPLLEVKIRNAVSERLLRDGYLTIVNRPEDADITLAIRLREFRHDPVRYDDDGNISEWRVAIVVSLELMEQETRSIIWKVDNFAGSQERFRLGSQTSSEDTAVDTAVADLARRVIDSVVELW